MLTERNANENVIRFDLSGTEKMRLDGGRLEFPNSGNSVFLGDSAGLADDLSNNQNVFVGHKAGRSNTTGAQNVFSGYGAGAANSSGFFNVFVGPNSGPSNTAGYSNVAIGGDAGSYNTTGSYNTCVGAGAGTMTTEGKRNTYLGAGAMGGFLDSGNVFVGYNVGVNLIGTPGVVGSDKLAIDNSTTATPLIYGDFFVDSVRINGGMSVARSVTATAFNVGSDRRLKRDIEPITGALDGVGKLNGVYYRYKVEAPDGNPYPQGRQIGVIAQDVEKVYPELVATQPGGFKAVDYPKLTAVLIEALKELNAQNAELQVRVQKTETALRLSGPEGKAGADLAASVR